MRSIQYLTIDINKRTQQIITANVGEIGSRYVKIKLTDNDKPLNLTGASAYLYALKSDDTKVFNEVEIEDAENGVILAQITSQLMLVAGSIKLTLVLLDGDSKLGSKEFTLNVDDSMLDDEVIESTNEFTALTTALTKVQNIDNRFAEVDEQFNTITNDYNSKITDRTVHLNSNNILTNNINAAQGVVTIISDDGHIDDYNWLKSLLDEKGVKGNVAIIPSFVGQSGNMNFDQIKELYDKGWDILGHYQTQLVNMSEQQLRNHYENDILKTFSEKGINVDYYCYPEGANNELVRNITKEYFRIGFSTGQSIVKIPLDSMRVTRPMIGSYTSSGQDTLEYYKQFVDDTKNNNKWCVFCLHSGATSTSQRQIISDLIDYIQTSNVKILSVTEALKYFENIIDVRDETTGNYFYVGRDGIARGKNIENAYIIDNSGIRKSTDDITLFTQDKTTISTFSVTDNSGFPGGAGVLETYRPTDLLDRGLAYQIWHQYGSNKIQKRNWNQTSKTWGSWLVIVGETIKIDNMDGRNLTDLISTYDNGKITYTPISSSKASSQGFPANLAGMLITERLYGENGFQRQKYKLYNQITEYERIVDTGGAWGEWSRVARIFPSTINVANMTVNANSVKEIDVTVNGVALGDVVFAQPNQVLEDNVTWSCHVYTSNIVKLRICNPTASNIALASRDWRFTKIQYR